MKEIVLQATIDWLFPLDSHLVDRIFNGRQYEKKQVIADIEENDFQYYIIKDE